MKISRRITVSVLAVVLCIGLSACGHKNPLQTAPEDDAANLLHNASKESEKQLNIQGKTGRIYGQCMEGQQNEAICQKLYKGMVEYAKSQPLFKGLSVSDLTDKGAYKTLKDGYMAQCFNDIDGA